VGGQLALLKVEYVPDEFAVIGPFNAIFLRRMQEYCGEVSNARGRG
jgi:hypothetical protein